VNRLPLIADWRLTYATQLPRTTLVLLLIAAILAVGISAFSLWRERRRGRAAALLGLRVLAVGACLLVALQPRLEHGQVTVVPNAIAVLVDSSRSMSVAPPDRGPGRAERAAALLADAAGRFSDWEARGHKVELFGFGEALEPLARGTAPAPKAEATRIAGALSELRTRFAGRDLGAIILISDGIDTGRIGPGPLDAETGETLAALGAPVHTVLIREPGLRDLSVANVLADDFAFVRTPLKLEAVLRHSGLGGRGVEVSLLRDGRVIAAKTATLRVDTPQETVVFELTPDHPGNHVFEIRTPVLAGEALETNNRQLFTVNVIRDRVRVLHVCGRPSWNERFLRAMLRLDPNVDLVSFFILRTDTDDIPLGSDEMSLIPFPYKEIFDEQLKSFDLLIFDNFNFKPYWVAPYLPGVRSYVETGGALAMIGGDLSFASGLYGESELQAVLPVELGGIPHDGPGAFTTDRFRPRLSPEGRTHPVTALSLDERANEARWAALPPLVGINRVAGLRPGARTLLSHPTHKSADGRPAPVLAAAEVGKGRSLALLTDSAWSWGFGAAGTGDDGRAFQHFWQGAIRWLVRDPALTLLRLDLDKGEYQRGQSPALRVRTLRPDFSAAPGVTVRLEVRSPDATSGTPPVRALEIKTGADGENHTELDRLEPGAYRLVGHATLDGRPVDTEATFVIRPESHELDDVVARDRVLREIAEASGGDFREGSLGNPSVRPPRKVRVGSLRVIEIWSNPLMLILVVGLLAAEWTVRRRTGHV
jgi:uncharacterized membrane protein